MLWRTEDEKKKLRLEVCLENKDIVLFPYQKIRIGLHTKNTYYEVVFFIFHFFITSYDPGSTITLGTSVVRFSYSVIY